MLRMLLAQFTDFMILLLIAAAWFPASSARWKTRPSSSVSSC